MIERSLTKDGQFIVITEKGMQMLYKEYLDYKKIFEKEGRIKIRGRVFSGVGEGRYYVSLEGYKKQFIEKLGFDPYPGTLNIKILKEEMYFRRRLDEDEGILIKGFSTEDRTFGDVKAFKCRVDGIDGAVVIPQRTHYPPDILEIISSKKLRDELELEDGDVVEVEVFL
jgi:riboflavin kinase